MPIQIEEFKSFIAQGTTSRGRGLNSLSHDKVDRSTQMCAVKSYAEEFTNKHTQQEVTRENNNLQVFLQASGVRHRPLKRKSSIEGTLVNKKKLKRRRANIYKTIHVGLGRQLKPKLF